MWQNMYQIDNGLMCLCKVMNTVMDNIYIGIRHTDIVWESVPIQPKQQWIGCMLCHKCVDFNKMRWYS